MSQKRQRERTRLGPVVVTVILSSLILAVLFGTWAVLGVQAVRRTLVEEARRDALALLESVVLASASSIASGTLVDQLEAEALVARARLLAGEIDPKNSSAEDLPALADRVESDGLTIWYGNGAPLSYPVALDPLVSEAPADLWDVSTTEPELEVLLADTVSDIRWEGALLLTAWGRLAVWRRQEGATARPSYGGVGLLMQEIAAESGINYIMLQAPEGIVFASRPLKPVVRLAADSFLVATLEADRSATREIVFEGQPVLEAAAPFLSSDLPSGMIRVGVSLAGVETAQERLTAQLGLSAVLLLLLSTAVVAVLVNRRSLADLGRSYRRVETMTSRILDAMDQGVMAVDRDGYVTVFNPAAEQITGLGAGDMIGRTVAEALGREDYRLDAVSRNQRAVRDREERQTLAGTVRELVYTTTPITSADGRRDGAVSVVRDETVPRALAARVRQAERLSEMGDLAAGVAHEIRNPLNAIALAAQQLQMEIGSGEAGQLAATVWEESKRLNAIIEDYLSLAHSGGCPTAPVDLGELIAGIAPMIELEAERTGVEFTVVSPPEELVVIGNADELKKALWNILSNAMAVLENGGRLTVTLAAGDAMAQITVDDTGPGIAAVDLPRVFQPYFTTKSGGTGLGLAITHRIVTDHGGTIEIISPVPESGGGTRVVILLPRADQIEETAGRPPQA